jgi:uncharacterized protein
MQIGVIGATGTIGSRIVSEALSRGHHVTAFSRDPSRIQDGRENITWKSLDVTDAESIAAVLPGLEVRPGLVFTDSSERIDQALDQFGLPREYAAAMRGHSDALNVFRIGGDQPVMDADGRSRISAEDAAIAVIDEAELPRFVQRRFTIGY